MSIISRLEKLVNLSSSLGLWLASVLLLAIAGIFWVEISGRTFAGWSTLITDEYSAYFLVGLSFLGFAYAFNVAPFSKASASPGFSGFFFIPSFLYIFYCICLGFSGGGL
jgi:hypothetical protein